MRDNISGDGNQNPTAISLFGQSAAANDFPVLKAFQEYIDAEQAKARKRMLGLSMFFIVLLVAVVITFTVIVISIFSHNRELSDRLLDILLRERHGQVPVQQTSSPQSIIVPQPVVTPGAASSQDAQLKPVLEKLEAIAIALSSRQQHSLQPAPVVVTTAPTTLSQQTAENAETIQMRELLKKQQAELESERARVKEAEEKLRKAEIERHRRRLYPEYYAHQDALAQAEQAQRQKPNVEQQVPTQELRPVEETDIAPKPARVFKTAPTPKTVPAPKPVSASNTASAPKAAPSPKTVAPKTAPASTSAAKPETSDTEAAPKSIKPINYFAQSDDLDQKPAPAQEKPAQPPSPLPPAKKVDTVPAPVKVAAPPSEKASATPPKSETPSKSETPPKPETLSKSATPPKSDKETDSQAKTEKLDVGTPIPWLIEQENP